MDIKLEERLIYRLMDFSNILGFSDKREHPTLDTHGSLHDEKQFESATVHLNIEALRKQSDNRMYLELLVLNPLRVNLTFQLSHIGLSKKDKETPLLEFARNLGFTIVSVDSVPLRLNALTLRHAFGSMTDLLQPIQNHYIQQGLREAYKVILSFDILGNPIHFVKDIGTGFKDFFVEPSRAITHSPDDFKAGLAKGTTSLIKHTVYAIANTTTSLTETTARGFAAMSMDKEYLSERDRVLREQPSTLGQGVVQGAKGLKTGVKYGVSGLVMLPYKGAKEEGAIGLAKGIPKGLAGVVLKPTAGAADLVAISSQSVRNMADPAPKLERKRTPRHFPSDGALAEYNAEKAYGGYLMQALFKHDARPTSSSSGPAKGDGDYLTPSGESSSSSSSSSKVVTVTSSPLHALDEAYVFHIIWRNSTTILFTNRRLACFADPRAIRKRWDVLLASMFEFYLLPLSRLHFYIRHLDDAADRQGSEAGAEPPHPQESQDKQDHLPTHQVPGLHRTPVHLPHRHPPPRLRQTLQPDLRQHPWSRQVVGLQITLSSPHPPASSLTLTSSLSPSLLSLNPPTRSPPSINHSINQSMHYHQHLPLLL